MGAKSNQGAPATSNTSTQSTVNTGPWQPQQPYLLDAMGKAQGQYDANASKTYFPGSTVAGINPTQNWGLQSILGAANQGPTNLNAANQENLDTLQGKYLDPSTNPWLKATFDQGGDAVSRQYMTATAPQTAGSMAAAGRYGSGAYANLQSGNQIQLGKTLNDLATNIYGGNYQTERSRQTDAVNQVPGLMQAKYIDPNAVLMAGNQMQQNEQAGITDQVNRFNFNRDQPMNALNTYLAQIQGNYGQSGATTSVGAGSQASPYYTNPGASAAGGALGLANLFTGGANSAASGLGGAIGSLFGKGSGSGTQY